MNTAKLAAAALMLFSTATGFAAETPEAPAGADKLNLPVLNAPSDTSREDAKADAVELLKDYKTTLSVQLDQYKP